MQIILNKSRNWLIGVREGLRNIQTKVNLDVPSVERLFATFVGIGRKWAREGRKIYKDSTTLNLLTYNTYIGTETHVSNFKLYKLIIY